jgi:hypothetical protein
MWHNHSNQSNRALVAQSHELAIANILQCERRARFIRLEGAFGGIAMLKHLQLGYQTVKLPLGRRGPHER